MGYNIKHVCNNQPQWKKELVGAPALGYLASQTSGSGVKCFERLVGFDGDDNDPNSHNPKVVSFFPLPWFIVV